MDRFRDPCERYLVAETGGSSELLKREAGLLGRGNGQVDQARAYGYCCACTSPEGGC